MADPGQLKVPKPRNEPRLPVRDEAAGSGNVPPPAGTAGRDGAGNGDGGDGDANDRKPLVLDDIIYPANRPYSARLYKERTRTLLASTFCGAFLLTLIFSFVGAIVGGHRWASLRDWLQIMLPAETGLFGSALGFYFASSANGRDDD